jgi:hypothetical protein
MGMTVFMRAVGEKADGGKDGLGWTVLVEMVSQRFAAIHKEDQTWTKSV